MALVASSLRDGQIRGLVAGVREAAAVLDWSIQFLDGSGQLLERTRVLEQLAAEAIDGLMVCGFSPARHLPQLEPLRARGVPIVGWHTQDADTEPVGGGVLHAQVVADGTAGAVVAARYVSTAQQEPRGIVLLTDSGFPVARRRAELMRGVLGACPDCVVLEVLEQSLSSIAQELPLRTQELMVRHGARWTHTLATHDAFFDFMGPVLAGPEAQRLGMRLVNVAAGDGSIAALQRIRSHRYQSATFAEPLNQQGWQLLDELNRAVGGAPPSGLNLDGFLVTRENIGLLVGPDNRYEPLLDYRAAWRGVWQR